MKETLLLELDEQTMLLLHQSMMEEIATTHQLLNESQWLEQLIIRSLPMGALLTPENIEPSVNNVGHKTI